MDYQMNINYLRKELLIHELVVRGVPVEESTTVEKLRAALRPLLKLEKAGAFVYPPYSLKFIDEKTLIRTLLDEANDAIGTLSGENAQGKFLSTQSRLVHLLNRVNRIPDSILSTEEQAERTELLIDVLAALDSLETACKQDPHLSVNFKGSDEDLSRHSSPAHNSTRNHVCNVNVPPAKQSNIQKWNLKFSGEIKKLSVHNFLERVEELRLARNLSTTQIFDSAVDLFDGKALNWFRANRNRFHDWTSLTNLLRRHFEPPDYRARLFKEILERTQDTSETIVDYLSCMQALFRRYDGLSEDAQLDILCRNLSPFYSTQLPVVRTLEELEEECIKLEVKKYRAESYVPPSRRRQQFVEPDFAYVGNEEPRPSTSEAYVNENRDVAVGEVSQDRHNGSSRNITCWNCKKTGHLNRDCPNPRKMHCYRCGAPDVTIRTCPKCSRSGNGSRRNQ
jgi:hypothetical protein